MTLVDLQNVEYYIFIPKPGLIEFLGEQPIRVVFCKTIVWLVPPIGNAWAMSLEETEEFYKLLFLANLITRVQKATPPAQEVLTLLLGDPPYRVEMFDRWWTITKTIYGSHRKNIVHSLSPEAIDRILPTHSEVIDHFLRGLIKSTDRNDT